MTQSRRANVPMHSARPTTAAVKPEAPAEEEEKIEYIEFINKLMHRMRLDSVKRMLEAALKEIG